jgi:hypothetical protein
MPLLKCVSPRLTHGVEVFGSVSRLGFASLFLLDERLGAVSK